MRRHVLCLLLVAASPVAASEQSTTATISGTVLDEHGGFLARATVSVRSLETGVVRSTTTDARGAFQVLGLPPGAYAAMFELSGFATSTKRDIGLTLNQHLELVVLLGVARVEEHVAVTAPEVELSRTALGRTFTTGEIEDLPVRGRDFSTLAQLTPGVLTNHSALRASPTNPGIAVAGQTSRNNRFVVDGVAFDSTQTGLPRGGFPIDAIREFAVLTNTYSAEFGQASGAVVSIVTRSGTNEFASRGFYFHRDDALDATPGTARIADIEKAALAQKTAGGFVGGPLRRDRAFIFSSFEATATDNQVIFISPVLPRYRPSAESLEENPARDVQVIARADVEASASHRLTARARFSRSTQERSSLESQTILAPERTARTLNRAMDVLVTEGLTIGRRALTELRLQYAVQRFRLGVDSRCPGCPSEDRPGLLLGAIPANPQSIDESRWQIANTFTVALPDWLGQHTFKAGFDVGVTDNRNDILPNRHGTFTFNTDELYDPDRRDTHPARFTQSFGESVSNLESRLYSGFVQDQWQPRPWMTLNVGARFDYVKALGVSSRPDGLAPRVGASVDPWRKGRTALRGGGGRYYDSVYVQFVRVDALADRQTTIRVDNPPYTLWMPGVPYVNPRDSGGTIVTVRDTRRLGVRQTPYTDQGSVGVQQALGPMLVSADVVAARGRRLLLTRDRNYPLNVGSSGARLRPDPALGQVNVVEATGHSSYRGLHVGLQARKPQRHGGSLAYTWSSSKRETEDQNFVAQDQRDPQADNGPSLSDARHRFVGALDTESWFGLRIAALINVRSALPYNVTTGRDDNFDAVIANDRPAGETRNARRGAGFWQIDVRVSRTFRIGPRRLEVLADIFNVANHRNWTDFDGRETSPFFLRPRSADAPREIQLGVRVDF